MFYECLELTVDFAAKEPIPPFIFDLYDQDKGTFGNSFDYMGRCLFFEEDAAIIKI